MKQSVSGKTEKLKRSSNQVKQCRHKKLSRTNQKALYEKFEGKEKSLDDPLNTQEAQKTWSTIWDKPFNYTKNAEWLGKVEEKLSDIDKQENISIPKDDIGRQLIKMPNSKDPGWTESVDFGLRNKPLHITAYQRT